MTERAVSPDAGGNEESPSDIAGPSKADGRGTPTPPPAETHSDEGESTDGGDDEEEETEEEDDEDDEDEEEEEDDEPRLKYARLTANLGPLYRNGDATSSFLVAGDKMIVGTHNGNINVIQLPIFQSLRVYHAHSASVTSVSISPFPPPLPNLKPEAVNKVLSQAPPSPLRPGSRQGESSPAAASRKPREPNPIPNTPSNSIYIATSSMDGNVCIQSLVDHKDVQLRNFARPVQAVALSPDYKNDRTYLSGGLAGNLILTVGGQPGRSISSTAGTAAATTSGWLGSMGLGSNTAKDTIIHSGEGTISTIKWSLSGKYVVWLNEHGIKIMRSKLHLESADAEDAWKRIGHVDRPETEEWEQMASVWKGRAEWIDEQALETDEDDESPETALTALPAIEKLKQLQTKGNNGIERLIVGWGSSIWIIHVHPGSIGVGKHAGERSAGRAEIVRLLRMDCIISGISLYTQNLLLVLAYCVPEDELEDEDDEVQVAPRGHKSKPSNASSSSEPSGGIRRRQNHLPPELRIIDLSSQAEVDKDTLSVSRFERLSSSDYHLGILPARNAAAAVSSKGALEALAGFGTDMWNAAINPKMLFSSGASIKSKDSNDGASGSKVPSTVGSMRLGQPPSSFSVHPNLAKPGVKIFIHSPYDCILATKRDLGDHLTFLIEHQEFQRAWELVDDHPEIMTTVDKLPELPPPTPTKTQTTQSSDDFYEDSVIDAASRTFNSSAEREKRRIGELWIKQLVEANDWTRAGEVAGKVLKSADRWERWVWTFAGAKKFDEITNYIPTQVMQPPLPGTIYEVVLGHYIQNDKPRFRELLDRWPADLFDIKPVTDNLENLLKYRDVREDSVEDGERGRDWRIVMESLAKLYEANGRHREALKCFIKLQDADSTFRLIRDRHLADAVADDIPSFIALRIPMDQVDTMSRDELQEATSEAITLLVDEAQHGLVKPDIVVSQLQKDEHNLYLFFYLRALWMGEGIKEHQGESHDRLVLESRALVDNFADLAVELFATFGRPLLMEFLKISTSYSFEKAAEVCESSNFIPELVFLYSKTGQMKRALYLIIDRLGDVSRAIAFAKEQDDPDLWEDLLNYSMDKPRFIRGLLEEVGTALDPITLVKRIPEGLEIEGLRDGLKHIMKEHEIQYSISSGVARVFRSEVAAAQATLRNGQRKGIKFEVMVQGQGHVDVEAQDVPTIKASKDGSSPEDAPELEEDSGGAQATGKKGHKKKHSAVQGQLRPGHCAQCYEAFTEWEAETLVGFACGHVFHLAHLLEFLHPGETVDASFGMSGDGGTRRNMIGSKVTHARLLKDRIRGGCPVCLERDARVS